MCFQPEAKIQNLVDLVHLLFPWPSLTPVLSKWKLGQEERIRERHPSSAAGCNILHRTWQIMKKLKAFLKVKYLYLEFLTVVGQCWCSSRLKFRCSSSKMLLLFSIFPKLHIYLIEKSLLLVPEGISALGIFTVMSTSQQKNFPSFWIKNWVCLIEKVCFCLLTERFLTCLLQCLQTSAKSHLVT